VIGNRVTRFRGTDGEEVQLRQVARLLAEALVEQVEREKQAPQPASSARAGVRARVSAQLHQGAATAKKTRRLPGSPRQDENSAPSQIDAGRTYAQASEAGASKPDQLAMNL